MLPTACAAPGQSRRVRLADFVCPWRGCRPTTPQRERTTSAGAATPQGVGLRQLVPAHSTEAATYWTLGLLADCDMSFNLRPLFSLVSLFHSIRFLFEYLHSSPVLLYLTLFPLLILCRLLFFFLPPLPLGPNLWLYRKWSAESALRIAKRPRH